MTAEIPPAIPKSAVARAVEQADAGPIVPAEQLALMPLARAEHEKPAASGVGGRPKGSPNKRTAAMVAYLTSRYAHPLEVLAQVISRPVADLAKEIGTSKADAFAFQIQAAKELAPYVAQKLPTLVDFKGDLSVSEGTTRGEILAEIAKLAAEAGVTIEGVANQGDSEK
jgi:hypothetical protein